jgi:hypothetical protein
MTDEKITAALAEVGAAWLMDEQDEMCQAKAIRHLVVEVMASEREQCARLCDVIEDGRLPDGSPVAGMAGECAWAIREGIRA